MHAIKYNIANDSKLQKEYKYSRTIKTFERVYERTRYLGITLKIEQLFRKLPKSLNLLISREINCCVTKIHG